VSSDERERAKMSTGQYCGEKGGTNNNIGRPFRKLCSLTDAKQHVKLRVEVCN
jgi:hypothetical protein